MLVVEGVIKSTSKRTRPSAAAALCRAQRRRARDLQLDRAAGAQRDRARRAPCRSARVSPRRRPRRTRCWCDSSTGATWSPECSEVQVDGTHPDRRGRRRPPQPGGARVVAGRPRGHRPPTTAPRRSTCSTREHGAFELLLTDIRMPIMDGIALALAAARDHPQRRDPADDRLCRPARARLRPRRAHPRRDRQAVLARHHPQRRQLCAQRQWARSTLIDDVDLKRSETRRVELLFIQPPEKSSMLAASRHGGEHLDPPGA